MGFKYKRFIQKIRKAKKNKVEGEKPAPVKTHYRNMVVGNILFQERLYKYLFIIKLRNVNKILYYSS